VSQVRRRFVTGSNGEMTGHFTAAEARKLRKNKPHPVSAFLAGAQFFLNPLEHRGLRQDKALQIKGVQLISASHTEAL
jgi:hypothetical protein